MLASKLVALPKKPSIKFDFTKAADVNRLSCTRSGATATSWAFAESDNPGATLQPIVIPANKVRATGLRWVSSTGLWSDTYANGTPIEAHFRKGLRVEGTSTNILLNSATVATQNITTTAQTYTLSAWGTGSIALSGTASGTLQCSGTLPDQRAILIFTATAGTLTITVSGNVVFGQLEARAYATSYTPTTGSSSTRNFDIVSYPSSTILNDSKGTIFMEVIPAFDLPNSSTGGFGLNYLVYLGTSAGYVAHNLNSLRRTDGTSGNNVTTPAWLPNKDNTYLLASKWSALGQTNFLSGTAGTTTGFDGSINSTGTMGIGCLTTGGNAWGGWIKKLIIYKSTLSDQKLIDLTTTYMSEDTGDIWVDENGDFQIEV